VTEYVRTRTAREIEQVLADGTKVLRFHAEQLAMRVTIWKVAGDFCVGVTLGPRENHTYALSMYKSMGLLILREPWDFTLFTIEEK
jgi:hypothetical protein